MYGVSGETETGEKEREGHNKDDNSNAVELEKQ